MFRLSTSLPRSGIVAGMSPEDGSGGLACTIGFSSEDLMSTTFIIDRGRELEAEKWVVSGVPTLTKGFPDIPSSGILGLPRIGMPEVPSFGELRAATCD